MCNVFTWWTLMCQPVFMLPHSTRNCLYHSSQEREWWNHKGVCNYCIRLSAIQIPDGNNVINLNRTGVTTRVTCSFVASPLITSCFSSTCAWYLALYLGLPYFQFLRLQAINWSQGRLGNKTTWRCHTYLPKASEVQASLYLGHFRWPQWRFNRMKIS